MKREKGSLWRDTDFRSYYDVTTDGTHPVPKDYEGELKLRPRIVEVVDKLPDGRYLVKALHTGRLVKVQSTYFYDDETNANGKKRTRGLVPHE